MRVLHRSALSRPVRHARPLPALVKKIGNCMLPPLLGQIIAGLFGNSFHFKFRASLT